MTNVRSTSIENIFPPMGPHSGLRPEELWRSPNSRRTGRHFRVCRSTDPNFVHSLKDRRHADRAPLSSRYGRTVALKLYVAVESLDSQTWVQLQPKA